MSARDREGLIARIRHVRRTAAARDTPPAGANTEPDVPQLQSVERRVAHLEQLVEGLQDSVHRESHRHSRRIAELEARIEPGALGAALSRDARERGL